MNRAFRFMSDRIPSIFHRRTGSDTEMIVEPPPPDLVSGTSRANDAPVCSVQHQYEELMQGSVPCPSCNGSGKIPKEREGELVALIPFNDDRLKPRRTWRYVLLGVAICVVISALLLFFLLPREVVIDSIKSPIEDVLVTRYIKNVELEIQFWNKLNVTNYNYYSVKVINATSQVINQFTPWIAHDVIGGGLNSSSVSIPIMANDLALWVNHTVSVKGPALRYCELNVDPNFLSLYIVMQFDFTVTFAYFTHSEQNTLSTRQQVCCVPSGNCTAAANALY